MLDESITPNNCFEESFLEDFCAISPKKLNSPSDILKGRSNQGSDDFVWE